MTYTNRQLLDNFISNKIKNGKSNKMDLKLIESRLFFFNKCIAVRSINNNNGHMELVINLHRYDKETNNIQNYLLNNSFEYNRTVVLFNDDKEFKCYCYDNFNIGRI